MPSHSIDDVPGNRIPIVGALLASVSLLGTVDTILVRGAQEHWGTEPRLFLHTLLLWGCLGVLALLPAMVVMKVTRRKLAFLSSLFLCLSFPILSHSILDAFTGIGGDTQGLRSAWPWLGVLGGGVACSLCAVGLEKLLVKGGQLIGKRLLVLVALCTTAGLTLPMQTEFVKEEGASGKPNLLLLVWDTVRAKSLSSFSDNAPEVSPNLTRLAERGVAFKEARSVSCFTFTSHLSMLTGVYPSEHGAWVLNMNYDPSRADHVAAVLHEQGYRTGAFVGTDVLAGNTGMNYGFEVYDDLVDPPLTYTHAWSLIHDLQSIAASMIPALDFNGRPHWIQDFQRPAEGALQAAQDWIGNGDERPWFCMINMYDAHWPYLPSEDAHAAVVGAYSGPVDGFSYRSTNFPKDYVMDDEDHRYLTELYGAEILELDAKVGAFLDKLNLDEGQTAVIVTADHGEAFGEGDSFGHHDIFEPQVRVPLLVVPSKMAGETILQPGTASHAMTSGIDVAPTLLGLAGIDVPPGMRGVDLARRLPDAERNLLLEDRDHTIAAETHLGIYGDGFKYTRTGVGEEVEGFLYVLASDPEGERDVKSEHPEVALKLSERLDALRKSWGGDEALEVSDDSNADALGALGYLDD